MNPRFGLAQRLLWLGVITTVLVLSVSGFVLRDRLHNAILRSLAASLNERADRISASMRLGDSGHIFQDAGLVPDEFRAIFSGWYWQLEAGNINKHSRSLWDSSLPLAQAKACSDDPELYRLTGPTGEALLGIRRTLDIGGQTPTLYLFGPADATLDELKRIDRVLLISLGILALTLLVSLWLQVRLGLRPLRRLYRALRDVQNGDASRVGSGYSPDLDPLAAEMDEVLERNARIVERARGHAADLSHALKKPLALLTAESGSGQVDGEKIRNQTDTMLRLIERHLARAGSGAGDVRRIDTAACVKNLLTSAPNKPTSKKSSATSSTTPANGPKIASTSISNTTAQKKDAAALKSASKTTAAASVTKTWPAPRGAAPASTKARQAVASALPSPLTSPTPTAAAWNSRAARLAACKSPCTCPADERAPHQNPSHNKKEPT